MYKTIKTIFTPDILLVISILISYDCHAMDQPTEPREKKEFSWLAHIQNIESRGASSGFESGDEIEEKVIPQMRPNGWEELGSDSEQENSYVSQEQYPSQFDVPFSTESDAAFDSINSDFIFPLERDYYDTVLPEVTFQNKRTFDQAGLEDESKERPEKIQALKGMRMGGKQQKDLPKIVDPIEHIERTKKIDAETLLREQGHNERKFISGVDQKMQNSLQEFLQKQARAYEEFLRNQDISKQIKITQYQIGEYAKLLEIENKNNENILFGQLLLEGSPYIHPLPDELLAIIFTYFRKDNTCNDNIYKNNNKRHLFACLCKRANRVATWATNTVKIPPMIFSKTDLDAGLGQEPLARVKKIQEFFKKHSQVTSLTVNNTELRLVEILKHIQPIKNLSIYNVDIATEDDFHNIFLSLKSLNVGSSVSLNASFKKNISTIESLNFFICADEKTKFLNMQDIAALPYLKSLRCNLANLIKADTILPINLTDLDISMCSTMDFNAIQTHLTCLTNLTNLNMNFFQSYQPHSLPYTTYSHFKKLKTINGLRFDANNFKFDENKNVVGDYSVVKDHHGPCQICLKLTKHERGLFIIYNGDSFYNEISQEDLEKKDLNIESLDFKCKRATLAEFRELLEPVKHIEKIILAQFINPQIDFFKIFTNLKSLVISNKVKIENGSYKHFSGLMSLTFSTPDSRGASPVSYESFTDGHIQKLVTLTYLDLGDNGTISDHGIFLLTNLTNLDLGQNKIIGLLSIQHLVNLTDLNLRNRLDININGIKQLNLKHLAFDHQNS